MPVIPLYDCGVLQAILCVSTCVFELRWGGGGPAAGAATTRRQTAQGDEKESERAATFNLHPNASSSAVRKHTYAQRSQSHRHLGQQALGLESWHFCHCFQFLKKSEPSLCQRTVPKERRKLLMMLIETEHPGKSKKGQYCVHTSHMEHSKQ